MGPDAWHVTRGTAAGLGARATGAVQSVLAIGLPGALGGREGALGAEDWRGHHSRKADTQACNASWRVCPSPIQVEGQGKPIVSPHSWHQGVMCCGPMHGGPWDPGQASAMPHLSCALGTSS